MTGTAQPHAFSQPNKGSVGMYGRAKQNNITFERKKKQKLIMIDWRTSLSSTNFKSQIASATHLKILDFIDEGTNKR